MLLHIAANTYGTTLTFYKQIQLFVIVAFRLWQVADVNSSQYYLFNVCCELEISTFEFIFHTPQQIVV